MTSPVCPVAVILILPCCRFDVVRMSLWYRLDVTSVCLSAVWPYQVLASISHRCARSRVCFKPSAGQAQMCSTRAPPRALCSSARILLSWVPLRPPGRSRSVPAALELKLRAVHALPALFCVAPNVSYVFAPIARAKAGPTGGSGEPAYGSEQWQHDSRQGESRTRASASADSSIYIYIYT